MTTRVSYLRQKYFRKKLGSCGRPLRDIDVKIEGTGTDGGELLVRGPNEMLEYWRKPEATENVFTEDGWLRTGDWAEIDEEGFVWLKGRRKDVVKRGGAAIYPEILENFVQTLQGVTDVAPLDARDTHGRDEHPAARSARPVRRIARRFVRRTTEHAEF
jgi:long-chain acyl-CoA synthetase